MSFFVFQAISYVVDTYRRHLRPVSLLDFATYLSFFPHLVAGPIVRVGEFVPQMERPADPREIDAARAFRLIMFGLAKKVIVAEQLAAWIVKPVFDNPTQYGAIDNLFGVYAYAIQIYADFSGYTDIAIGLALLLGIRFPQNFNSPYIATTLQDFWRRWHMTLSRWLRDYLYIGLGGNRKGETRTCINLFLTMFLGGLWHGASWTFVVWGTIHGRRPGPGADLDAAAGAGRARRARTGRAGGRLADHVQRGLPGLDLLPRPRPSRSPSTSSTRSSPAGARRWSS